MMVRSREPGLDARSTTMAGAEAIARSTASALSLVSCGCRLGFAPRFRPALGPALGLGFGFGFRSACHVRAPCRGRPLTEKIISYEKRLHYFCIGHVPPSRRYFDLVGRGGRPIMRE